MQVHPGPSQPQQMTYTTWTSVQSHTARCTGSPPPVYEPPPSEPGYGFKPGTDTLYQPTCYPAPPAYGSWQQQQPQPQPQPQPQQQIAGPSFQATQGAQMVQVTVASAPTVNVPVTQPVVITQPTPVIVSPPSYLGWSIFNFLCCFWPLGLAALIYSVKVGCARSADEARKYSLTAKNLNTIATALAPVLLVIVVAAVVGGGAARGSRTRYYDDDYYYYGYNNSYRSYYSYLTTYSYINYDFYFSYYYGYYYYSYIVYGYQYVAALG